MSDTTLMPDGRVEMGQVSNVRHVYFALGTWDMIKLLFKHRRYQWHVQIDFIKQTYSFDERELPLRLSGSSRGYKSGRAS